MNIPALWAEIEEELSWRQAELRFLKNQIERLENSEEKKKMRRSVVLMIYAHFEGFVKYSLTFYIKVINSENLECGNVNRSILACAFSDIFKALRNPNSKSEIFKSALPDDSGLHRFARSVHFLNELDEKLSQKVTIPDSVVNTESNLKPKVIQKLLFSVGLDHSLFEDQYGEINRLLNQRNKIGHGETRSGIEATDFNILYSTTFGMLNVIKSKVMNSITNQVFLHVA